MNPWRYQLWTVTAHDEFDRYFHYQIIENYFTMQDMYFPDYIYEYALQRAAREILKEMGEAAHAEWWCEERNVEL